MQPTEAMHVQARAIADPSRYRLFCHVAASDVAVSVAELTELLGFNHNAIRQHLAVLVSAGLLDEFDEARKVRGRPRKLYTLRADALSAFAAVSGSYRHLADLLLELVSAEDAAYEVGFRAGASDAIAASADHDQTVALLVRRLATDGFEPTVAVDGVTTLRHCPYADVAAKNQGVVCELHRGLIDGQLANQLSARRADLAVREPHSGLCQVTIAPLDGARTDAADS